MTHFFIQTDLPYVQTHPSKKPYDIGIMQVLIMEAADMSAADALDEKYPVKIKQSIVSQMINLIKQLIFEYGLHCIDIKPENFVYKVDNNKVKIIDFGADYCNLKTNIYPSIDAPHQGLNMLK